MAKDGVTLENCAGDYGRRCESIGNERRIISDLQDAINHPEFKKRHHALLDELAQEQRLRKPLIERAPFVTVPAKEYKLLNTPKKLEQSLSPEHRISNWGKDLTKHMKVSGVIPEEDVDFVDASNAELGYADGCTVAQTIEAAARFNLEPCFHEDGQLVRKHYTNQPMNDRRLVALKESITDSNGDREVWYLYRDTGGSWLHSDDGDPDSFCGGDVRWVFRRKRPLVA